MTRNQFFAAIAPAVVYVKREGSAMFPSVRMAQSLLESGGDIHPWNNLGGIKTGNGKTNRYWHGEVVVKGTWEVIDGRTIQTNAAFRAYKTLYHFYKDLDVLLGTARYERVRLAKTPEQQAEMLYACGYATDPAYASKLQSLIGQYKLKMYDEEMLPEPAPKRFEASEAVPIAYKGMIVGTGRLVSGTTWVPARRIGEALGAEIDWTGTKVTVNEKELESILSVTTGYVKVRDLAVALSIPVNWEPIARVVMLG